MSLRTATVIINHKALLNNVAVIKQLAPKRKILAILKANAYGHGLEHIAKLLAESLHENEDKSESLVDAFGVARLDEAIALRTAGISKPIVLLEGFFCAEELTTFIQYNLETVIHNQQQLTLLLNASLTQTMKVWLKIDTGMHRLGIEPEEFNHIYSSLKNSQNVQSEITLMTHLSCADDVDSDVTEQQLSCFHQLIENANESISIANSAGICAWENSHGDWLRPGIMLYGISPMLKQTAESLNLQPVMTLKASLIAIRDIKAGEAVGYGASWISERDTKIGVVAVGYGDGYPRHAKNGTPVLINGRIVPLVGRVSMDMITVDLGQNADDITNDATSIYDDKVGDIATLWGQGLAVEDIAEAADTIAYELLCNISQRVKVIDV
jgi:alanine racemase